jgi:hypothetical protein
MLYKNSSTGKVFIRMILDGLAGIRFLFSGSPGHFGAVIRAHLHFYRRIGDLRRKKNCFSEMEKIPNRDNELILKKSLVFQYFVKGRKRFSDLDQYQTG